MFQEKLQRQGSGPKKRGKGREAGKRKNVVQIGGVDGHMAKDVSSRGGVKKGVIRNRDHDGDRGEDMKEGEEQRRRAKKWEQEEDRKVRKE